MRSVGEKPAIVFDPPKIHRLEHGRGRDLRRDALDLRLGLLQRRPVALHRAVRGGSVLSFGPFEPEGHAHSGENLWSNSSSKVVGLLAGVLYELRRAVGLPERQRMVCQSLFI